MADNLSIQIKFHLDIPISEYKQQILTGKFALPDFSERCPLCGAKDCACFLGFYQRDTENSFKNEKEDDVPIIRFECQRVNPVPWGTHKTFSLLPDTFIPYKRRDMETIHRIVRIYVQNGRSLTETAGELTIQFGLPVDIYFSTASIWRYVRLFETAQTRYKAFGEERLLEDMPWKEFEKESRRFPGFLLGTPSQGRSPWKGQILTLTPLVTKKNHRLKKRRRRGSGGLSGNHTTLKGRGPMFYYPPSSYGMRRLL